MDKLRVIFKPFASILFLRDYKLGIFIFLLSFILPSVAILGIVGLFSTILFAEFVKIRDEYLKYGFYLYNSLLVGMGVGYFYDISLVTIIITIILSIFTFLLSFGLHKVFSYWYMPILSLPFAFMSMLFYLASLKYTTLLSNLINKYSVNDISIKIDIISAYFKSLGTIFFLPYNIAGIVIVLIMLFYSRIMFIMSVIGFLAGVFFHSLFVPYYTAINSPYNFNFILIAIALGGVFLIPNLKNYFLAILGVLLSVVLIDSMEVFFNMYSLPVYTLPFNIVVLLFLMLLYWIGYKYYNFYIKETPEKSLLYFLSNIYRFGGNDIKIYLPFIGKWSVYQAFDGEWTHKGKWKYAYDFVIKKNGKTYANDGLYLEDYYAFAKPIIAPINGYVVALRDDLPDNFIGSVDRINNWGNYIIIKSDYGFYVEISHLMQNSINVKIGDYVRYGDIIGKCGNSGYSPEPHIHIQVQKYPFLGSETIPFKFVEYIKDNYLHFYSLPKKDDEIESFRVDKSTQLKLNFILDENYKYEIYENNEKIGETEFIVSMNEKGEFYFKDNNENKLYFYSAEKFFYFYKYEGGESYLKELFKLAPKIPFINQKVKFFDILPIDILYSHLKLVIKELLISVNYKFFAKKFIYEKDFLRLKSDFGEVIFSFYEKGFDKIIMGEKQLRRIDEKNNNTD
jgi:urea transporter/murein DD-endopeptidase MepM/ murein hydrolase activator NlpD